MKRTESAQQRFGSTKYPKEKRVPAVKASFDFCSQAVAKLQDSQMGDPIIFFGGRKTPRSRAVIELVSDLVDDYSQLAS